MKIDIKQLAFNWQQSFKDQPALPPDFKEMFIRYEIRSVRDDEALAGVETSIYPKYGIVFITYSYNLQNQFGHLRDGWRSVPLEQAKTEVENVIKGLGYTLIDPKYCVMK